MKRPVPDPSWSAEVRAVYEHDLREIWDPRIAPQVWNQYHNQLDTCFSVVGTARGLRILDIGCAQATLALLLAERGHEVWAVDIREEFLKYAASRHESGTVHFVCGNALELDFVERFDMIFANQVIEHVVYPAQVFARAKALLAPGGRFVVATPNYDYVMNTLPGFADLGDVAQYAGRQHSADADGHFFAYRGRELHELLRQAGFTRVDVGCFETPFISGHMKIRHAHRFVPTRVLRALDRALLRQPVLGWKLSHQLLAVAS